MKAKMIWIAQHPDEPSNREISFTEPNDTYTHLYTGLHTGEDACVEWKSFLLIEVEM